MLLLHFFFCIIKTKVSLIFLKSVEDIIKLLQKWYILDGTDKILWRFSCTVCNLLTGKYDYLSPQHVKNIYVIVTNAQKINGKMD